MKTKFVSDCSCDMWSMEGVDFVSVPLTISTDEASYTDDENLDLPGMLDYLAAYKGRSYSACPSINDWLQSFQDADRVYVATLTSGLSGTYNSAMNAREMFLQKHPDAEIHVFDTLSTGPEQRLLMEKLVELDAAGIPFEEVCRQAQEYLSTTRLFFALKSLHIMAQNGRINKAIAAAIGVLGISIFATASPEGTIEPISKCRSEKKVISSMLAHLESAGYRGGKLRMSHAENPTLVENIRQAVLAKYPEADILIYPTHGLCSYYAERGGILVGCECE